MNPPKLSDRCCFKCHFVEQWRLFDKGVTHHFEVAEAERKRLLDGEDWRTVVLPEHVLACFKGIWDAANFRKGACRDVPTILSQDRGGSCFFYPHTPGIFLPQAAELERRAADRREATKDRALTRKAFWVALGALIVSIVATVAGLLWDVWKHFYPR